MAKQRPAENVGGRPSRGIPGTPAERTAAAHKETPRIKVRAVRMGYYDNARRRPGHVFTIRESDFSARWMERVTPNTPETATRIPGRREHATLIQGATPPKAPTGEADEPNPLDA